MKLLRKYIRQIILVEQMMGVNQIPSDVKVYIQDIDGDASSFSIFYKTPRVPYPVGEIKIASQPKCDGAMRVVDIYSELENGGPLLYDLAIEVATIYANGLTADRDYVSDSARPVWEYYLKNRRDVDAFALDPKDCPAKYTINQWMDSPLSKRFVKKPTSLRKLEKMGKLVNL